MIRSKRKYLKIIGMSLLIIGYICSNTVLADGKTEYVYDELGRLIETIENGSKEIYEYDANGNITSVTYQDKVNQDTTGGTAADNHKESTSGSVSNSGNNSNNQNELNTYNNADDTDRNNNQNNKKTVADSLNSNKSTDHSSIKEVDKNYFAGNLVYQIINQKKRTVKVVGTRSKNKTNYSVPAKIKIKKKDYTVTEIGQNAFKNCKKAKKITIGKNVRTIGKNVFYGCKKVKVINVNTIKLIKVGKNALKGIHKNAKIKVPKKKLVKYNKLFKNKGQKKTVKVVRK